jgi:hypothetical protein
VPAVKHEPAFRFRLHSETPKHVTEALIVFGGIIVALSALITAAIDYSSVWRRVIGFVVTVLVFVCLASMGAMMGIIIREAVKAIR